MRKLLRGGLPGYVGAAFAVERDGVGHVIAVAAAETEQSERSGAVHPQLGEQTGDVGPRPVAGHARDWVDLLEEPQVGGVACQVGVTCGVDGDAP